MQRDNNNEYTTKFDTTYAIGNTNPLTSKWAKVPTSQTPETIKHTEDTPQESGDNTTVYYGVNVPKNKTAGQYQTTITYTATANILDPPEVEKVEPSSIRQSLQMTVGETSDQTFTCYVTTAGSVYCTGPTTAGTRSDFQNGYYTTPYDQASWMGYVAPASSTDRSDISDEDRFRAYTTIEVGTEIVSSNQKRAYYWFKIDTSKFGSSSTSAGTTITLTGKNLSKVTGVYIDANNNGILDEGVDVSVNNLTIISDTQLTFTAPSMSAGTYNIIVVNPGNVVVGGTLTYR